MSAMCRPACNIRNGFGFRQLGQRARPTACLSSLGLWCDLRLIERRGTRILLDFWNYRVPPAAFNAFLKSTLQAPNASKRNMLAGEPVDAEMDVADAEMATTPQAPDQSSSAKAASAPDLALSLFPELDAAQSDAVKDLSQDLSQDMLDWSEDEADAGSSKVGTTGPTTADIVPGSFKAKPKPVPVPRELTKKDVDDGNFLALMKVFYQRLFPWKKYFQWLSYGNGGESGFRNLGRILAILHPILLVVLSYTMVFVSTFDGRSSQDLLPSPRIQFYPLRRHLPAFPIF